MFVGPFVGPRRQPILNSQLQKNPGGCGSGGHAMQRVSMRGSIAFANEAYSTSSTLLSPVLLRLPPAGDHIAP